MKISPIAHVCPRSESRQSDLVLDDAGLIGDSSPANPPPAGSATLPGQGWPPPRWLLFIFWVGKSSEAECCQMYYLCNATTSQSTGGFRRETSIGPSPSLRYGR